MQLCPILSIFYGNTPCFLFEFTPFLYRRIYCRYKSNPFLETATATTQIETSSLPRILLLTLRSTQSQLNCYWYTILKPKCNTGCGKLAKSTNLFYFVKFRIQFYYWLISCLNCSCLAIFHRAIFCHRSCVKVISIKISLILLYIINLVVWVV